MTTYRAPRDGSHGGWTTISNAIAEDRRLTPDGLALVVYLLERGYRESGSLSISRKHYDCPEGTTVI